MARLEIEIVGLNDKLKTVLRQTSKELTEFGKGLDLDDTGIKRVNSSLLITKRLLKDIASLSKSVNDSLGGKITSNNIVSDQLARERLAFAQAKTEAQNYRTEAVKLSAQLQDLRLKSAQSRQSTTAASGSYKEAQQTLSRLGRSIREAAGGFTSTDPLIRRQITQYRELNAKLKEFDAQLGNHQRNVGNYAIALNSLKGLAASYFGFTALLAAGRQVLQSNAQISDSLADVRRTAELTAKEAERLSEALKTIDTRTGLKDLLDISVIGGQLGIAKDQLAGFTKAIDQLAVTLSGELKGGAEGVAKSLGVLDNVFKITQSNGGNVEKSLNQIGSSILALGQSGLATGDFLADFGERVGGVAKQAGISLPTVLAFGAVLQENGVSAEVAGTAFKKLISALANNSGKFFQVAKFGDANLTLKEFNTLVNTDTKIALDLLFNGLRKGGESTIAFNSILKQLKLSQSGISQSVAALVAGQGNLNKYVALGTDEFNKATLSGEQFAIKNETLGASLDKLGNTFVNITTSGAIGGFFKAIIDGANQAIIAIGKMIGVLGIAYNLLTRPKQFVQYSATSVRDMADAELNTNAAQSAAAQIKNQTGKKQAFELLQREAKLLGVINDRYKELKITYESTKEGDRTLADTQQFQEVEKSLKFQKSLVKGLNKEYDSLYRTIYKPRSNAEAPVLGDAKKGGSKAMPKDYEQAITNIATKSINDDSLNGLADLAKTNEKTKQQYAQLNADLDKLQKEYTFKYKDNLTKRNDLDKQTLAARKLLNENENAELLQNQANFNQKQSDLIAGIEDKAGVIRETSRAREIQLNDAYYAELQRKYKNNADVLATIQTALLTSTDLINQKWNDKNIEDQQKVFDKINDITEKGFTDNIRQTAQGNARIDAQLKERLAKITRYYQDLAKLNGNSGLSGLATEASELIVKKIVIDNAAIAKNPAAEIAKQQLKDAANSFGQNFSNTLRNLNSETDRSFRGLVGIIGDSLNDELNNVFNVQLKKTLNNLVETNKISTQDALTAIGGLVGNLITGITKKSSTIGQATGGALTGAAAGASLGADLVPIGGGLVGGIIGGVAGLIGGIFGSSKAKKQEALQKAQLEEAKKQTKLQERTAALAYSSSIIGQKTNQGIVTGIERNEFGDLVTKVSGSDLLVVLDRTTKNRNRGV